MARYSSIENRRGVIVCNTFLGYDYFGTGFPKAATYPYKHIQNFSRCFIVSC
jgi:hypothetical protein